MIFPWTKACTQGLDWAATVKINYLP